MTVGRRKSRDHLKAFSPQVYNGNHQAPLRQPLSNAQALLTPFEDRLQMLKRATPSWMRVSLLERVRQRGDDGKLKAIVRKLPTLSKDGGKGFGSEAVEKGEVEYDLIG